MTQAPLDGGVADTGILPSWAPLVNTFHLLTSWLVRPVGARHQNGPAACSPRLSLRGGISQTLARSLPPTRVRTPWRLTT
ncbi:hypothetical protein G6F40_016940 [Rhizopus arrhizus]|nr:hypothetical protein G6F40_016940 [Rhizopus arrhizus]